MADKTSSSIRVAAPPARVMEVIADFGAYPQWASAIRSAEVVEQGEDGRASRVRFQLDAGMVRDTYVLGYRWEASASVRWDMAEPGSMIAGMSGGYQLADRGGATDVTYDLAVDIRIPVPGMFKRKAEKIIVDTALQGLKDRVEARGGDSG